MQLSERMQAQIQMEQENRSKEELHQEQMEAVKQDLEAQLAAAEAATSTTAVELAQDHINQVRARAQEKDAASFEAQRRLNEQLALLSENDEQKLQRLQGLARTCEELRSVEAQLRSALAEEQERNAKLVAALDDQALQEGE